MLNILLQAQGQSSSPWSSFIFFGAIIVVFYLFMIRPQQKKAKDQKKFVEAIQKGDHVVTIGGIHGRIADIENDTVIVEVEKGGRIRFSRSSISMEATKVVKKT